MLQENFCFILFCFAKLEIKGNPWLKSAVPDSVMAHHLWCHVADQRLDFLGLLLDLDFQSQCSAQCQLRTRGWHVLLQHKASERKGALRELHSLSPFSSAPPEKERNKQRKGRWENHAKTGRKVLGEQKPECLCNWEVSAYLWPLCAALLPRSVGISGDISGDHDSWISPPFPRVCWDQEQGSGCKTQLNPRSFPFTHLKHCTTLMPCAPRQGSAGWCQRESAAFVSHFY